MAGPLKRIKYIKLPLTHIGEMEAEDILSREALKNYQIIWLRP